MSQIVLVDGVACQEKGKGHHKAVACEGTEGLRSFQVRLARLERLDESDGQRGLGAEQGRYARFGTPAHRDATPAQDTACCIDIGRGYQPGRPTGNGQMLPEIPLLPGSVGHPSVLAWPEQVRQDRIGVEDALVNHGVWLLQALESGETIDMRLAVAGIEGRNLPQLHVGVREQEVGKGMRIEGYLIAHRQGSFQYEEPAIR
jgi:hypothetical protein